MPTHCESVRLSRGMMAYDHQSPSTMLLIAAPPLRLLASGCTSSVSDMLELDADTYTNMLKSTSSSSTAFTTSKAKVFGLLVTSLSGPV